MESQTSQTQAQENQEKMKEVVDTILSAVDAAAYVSDYDVKELLEKLKKYVGFEHSEIKEFIDNNTLVLITRVGVEKTLCYSKDDKIDICYVAFIDRTVGKHANNASISFDDGVRIIWTRDNEVAYASVTASYKETGEPVTDEMFRYVIVDDYKYEKELTHDSAYGFHYDKRPYLSILSIRKAFNEHDNLFNVFMSIVHPSLVAALRAG